MDTTEISKRFEKEESEEEIIEGTPAKKEKNPDLDEILSGEQRTQKHLKSVQSLYDKQQPNPVKKIMQRIDNYDSTQFFDDDNDAFYFRNALMAVIKGKFERVMHYLKRFEGHYKLRKKEIPGEGLNIKQDILAYAEQKGITPKKLTDDELKGIRIKKSASLYDEDTSIELEPIESEPIVEPNDTDSIEIKIKIDDTDYIKQPDTAPKTETKRISDKLCERFAEYGQWKSALVAWAQDSAIRGKPKEMEDTIIRLLELYLSDNKVERQFEKEHVITSSECKTAMEYIPEEIKDALKEFRRVAYFDDVTNSFDKVFNLKFKEYDDAQTSAIQLGGVANTLEEMGLNPIKKLVEGIASKVKNQEYKKQDDYTKDLENAAEIFYRTINNCSKWMEDEYLSDDRARENYAAIIMRCNTEVALGSFRKVLESGVNGESENTAKIIDGMAKNLTGIGIDTKQLEEIASNVRDRKYNKIEFLKQINTAREAVYNEIYEQTTAKLKETFNKLVSDRYKAVANKFGELLQK